MSTMNTILTVVLEFIFMLFSGIGVHAISKMEHRRRPIVNSRKHKTGYQFLDNMESKVVMAEPGVKFTIYWYVKNTGNYTWAGCKIESCVNSQVLFPMRKTFRVPETPPGQIAEICAEFRTDAAGDYATLWKMYDADNNEIFAPGDYLTATVVIR